MILSRHQHNWTEFGSLMLSTRRGPNEGLHRVGRQTKLDFASCTLVLITRKNATACPPHLAEQKVAEQIGGGGARSEEPHQYHVFADTASGSRQLHINDPWLIGKSTVS